LAIHFQKNLSAAWLIMLGAFALAGVPTQTNAQQRQPKDTVNQEYKPSNRPVFKSYDRYGDPFSNNTTRSPLFLKDPGNLKLDVEIDTSLNYTIYEKIGDLNYRPTSTMTFEEFMQYQNRRIQQDYWRTRSKAMDGVSPVAGKGFTPKLYISPVLDRIFGGSYVELVPRGMVVLDFGGSFQKINNPQIPIRQQRNGGFEFDQQINMSVVGKVGEKLAVTANFDNNNSFDFQNNMKVEYTGFKEDILQKLEIGNVSLPLNNTLIQGAQNLFGVKAQMQFGKLNVTALASTQRGQVTSLNIPGGNSGQGRPFEIVASNYDENRHFFLGHFFKDNYRRWIQNLPQITSGINITRVEVYILNRNNDTQTLRNVVGLMDLAEPSRIYNGAVTTNGTNLPNANASNNLFAFVSGQSRNPDNINSTLEGFFEGESNNGTDFEKITGARKLNPTEYTFHRQLGYISLTRKLANDEALAVAYEYTYNGRSYKVGELSEDYSNLRDDEVIFLKLLRPRRIAIRDERRRIIPTWELMMKNIYNLNVNQLAREGFQLRVIYRDDRTGIDNPQLQEGSATLRERQLIEVLGLDKLNPVNDPQRDGNFDFVDGITINTQTGLIIFPYLEPFNVGLREAFRGQANEDFLIQKYAYDTLYRTTKADAELFATKNKFFLVGTYNAGSAKDILIPGFGVSQGSVRVFAGGIPLQEGTDFTVDYTFGRVTILNESILSSGKDISVQYEQSDPFAFQTRSLLGTRFDYKMSKDVNFGSTLLYYNERPIISRNQIGQEPARNVQYGMDFNIRKDSRILTKMVDALPFIQTKEPSSFNITGEFAQLLPGTSNIVNGEGIAYIDDFENTATPYSLMAPLGWRHAATPRDPRFDPSLGALNDLRAGYKRAKLAWYTVDNQVYRDGGPFKPANITEEDTKNHYVRAVGPQEIFPQLQLQQAVFFQQILDLAYYPRERGPYNFNPALDANGFLADDPKTNWAGITTAIRTEVDFDKANIEYVEFWMLDPFIPGQYGKVITKGKNEGQNNTTGGKIIFQLGSISEDIMRDSRHAFENGLPPDGNLTSGQVQKNEWGYVTTQQFLTNAFDNSNSARNNQDVGLDGVSNDEEPTTFNNFLSALNPTARQAVLADPAADNFRFWIDPELDAADAQVLERYKNINGLDGNSPVVTGNDQITRSGSQQPDNEDLNVDNTLSELEEYYEYDVDLKPGLDVGNEYIVDKITTSDNAASEAVTWYLFRIPVRDFERKFGNINGFKSIRYARMLLTGFEQPVVLRLANFRMIGSRWRRYTADLRGGGFDNSIEPNFNDFTVSVVNLEENAQSKAGSKVSAYRIPPGVVRDRDPTSAVSRQVNEQSVQLCVDQLKDGDARAIYKNVSVDLFNYGRIKMYLHANTDADDGQMHAFVRFGTDFTQNYYEVEIPLKKSDPSAVPDPREIWPEENEIDLDLNELYALKAARDRERFPIGEAYPREGPKTVGKHLLRIFGRPDLSSVQVMMIGVRNPKSDDKRNYEICLWANELRVSDFNRKAGWAVSTTVSTKLADFATLTGALRYTTFGFGAVSSKIGERTRDETTAMDVSANVNVDKLIPGNTGIKIPMFVSYQNTTINPQYDPANPDLRISAALKALPTDEERRDFKKLIQNKTTTRSLNFMNVRKTKVKTDAVSHIYDIENFSFNYSYSERQHTDFFTKENLQKQYRGGIVYNFSPKNTGIEPFKESKGLKSPYLKLIKDFNFSLLPDNIMIRADVDRSFSKRVYRNSAGAYGEFTFSEPNYLKYFTFNRQYNVRWALSKGLTLEYQAMANAIIDEPEGELNTQAKRDSVISNFKRLGRMKNFDQSVTLNYTVPLDKFPLTDFLAGDVRYSASYNWKAGPVNIPDAIAAQRNVQDLPDSLDFKNTIQNSRETNFSGKIDMVKLYNKVKFLKELNTPPKPKAPAKPAPGRPVAAQQNVKQDTTKKAELPRALKGFFRLLMSVRSVNGTYTRTEGTLLPGFENTPSFFGMDRAWSSPGWSFILGSQNPDIRLKAGEKGWLATTTSLTTPFTQNRSETINLRANIEPSTELKITVDVRKEGMTSYQEIYRFDDAIQGYQSLNPSRSGSYKISFSSIRTAFDPTNGSRESAVFKKFEENLEIARQRFEVITSNPEFDTTSQDVIIPAFIAAYSGKDVRSVSLSPFPRTPLPNWRIDYNGLSKVGIFKDLFQSVTISHAYSSSYSVMNYSNSLEYNDPGLVRINRPIEDYNRNYFGSTVDGKFVPVFVISQVMISEAFQPLFGINLRTKSRLQARAEYKTKRDLALNISNAQVTEVSNKEVSFELGYTKNNMRLPFRSQGRTIVLKNDVTFRMNLTVSDQRTIQRKINELSTVTNGNVNFQLRPNINYVVNQKLTLQAYFERTINEPQVSNAFRRATTRFGVQVRFSLAQ